MDICYIDESGGADLLHDSTPDSTPIYAFGGLIVPEGCLTDLVWDYLQVKKKYNPSLADAKLSDLIGTEIKGANLRADIRSGKSRRYRRAIGMLDRTFDLLEHERCKIISRIVVKGVDTPIDDTATYRSAIGWMCGAFERCLEERDRTGLVILDSRTKWQNTPNTNSITTQVYRHGGNPLPRLEEVPVFGHSDSHVALQLADILVSAVLFPIACAAFCSHLAWNQHAHPKYDDIRFRYGARLKDLQYRYFDPIAGHWKGGVHATGVRAGLAVSEMFKTFPGAGSPHLPGIVIAP